MNRCEDFPCCGHEPGDCPVWIEGLRMIRCCECSVLFVPVRSSMCDECITRMTFGDWDYYPEEEDY